MKGTWDTLLDRARRGEGPLKHARAWWRAALRFHLPLPRVLAGLLYAERGLRQRLLPLVAKMLYREPLMRYRCSKVGARLNLEGEIPLIIGGGRIEIGDDVLIGRRNTWVVGTKASTGAELIIETGAAINYAITISVMKSVRIGRGTLLAANVQIYDNPSHPLDPDRRARGEGVRLDEARPVVLGNNVWVATGSLILSGVEIGDNSVVGAGSVVTKSVPPNSLVAGNPARVIRSLATGPGRPPA